MKLVDSSTMKSLDAAAMKRYGIPGLVLMENAGRGVAEIICREFDRQELKRISIFAGKGNNGGDGFVAARYLKNWGFDVTVYLLAKPSDVKGDAKTHMDMWIKMDGKTHSILSMRNMVKYKFQVLHSQIIIDAIFGTGLAADVRGIHGQIIDFINRLNRPVVSIDIPSGLDASNGKVLGSCVRGAITVTMGLPKVGLFLYPGAEYAGKVRVVDIGMPSELIETAHTPYELIDRDFIKPLVKKRGADSHKGDFGHLFILAGSVGKTGAAAMTSLGAMRVGAGLVTLGIPESLNPIFEKKLTEVMTLPLEESAPGILGSDAFKRIAQFIKDKEAVVLGPGLTTQEPVKDIVLRLIQESHIPLVIDADAVNCLASNTKILKKAKVPVVITPHPGEMARILGITPKEVQADRIGIAARFSKEHGVIVVLKGARTIIAEPSGRIFINPTGNPGMATAGTGDVLAGMIGGLIAQGYSPLDASNIAVYAHGLAGDEVAKEQGEIGMIATDILDAVPFVINSLLQDEKHSG